jgi:hypothetical protein
VMTTLRPEKSNRSFTAIAFAFIVRHAVRCRII